MTLPLFRAFSLLLPSAGAFAAVALARRSSALDDALLCTLAPLWLATLVALLDRGIGAALRGRSWDSATSVLTASGCGTAWLGAGAIVMSLVVGWASLAVVGLLGLSAVHLVALTTLLRVGGHDAWRAASLTRSFLPATVFEGEGVVEEIVLSSPRIPSGFRLFVKGTVGERWPVTRHVVHAGDSSGQVVLTSEIGPATRGQHDAEALTVWLQDVFGLCHSPPVRVAPARLTALPRTPCVTGARALVGPGGHDGDTRPTRSLATSGSFHLREYRPGDDARRIHWLRSAAARELVVRLPDEVADRNRHVRLILDTHHRAFATPAGRAEAGTRPLELLDALVKVWLGVARALGEAQVRVTLVCAAAEDGSHSIRPVENRWVPTAIPRAERLGASVAWQDAIGPAELLGKERCLIVSCRLPQGATEAAARWIVVPAQFWAIVDRPRTFIPASGLLPYAPGTADNRWSRWRVEKARRMLVLERYGTFLGACAHSHAHRAGNFVARPVNGRVALEVLS
jgi:uncharacterized protein (DUF58 family)